jgi:hypothetical protein
LSAFFDEFLAALTVVNGGTRDFCICPGVRGLEQFAKGFAR